MANKMTNPMKVITGPKTRWSYANVWEPKSINGGTAKYSVCLLIPKEDTNGLLINDFGERRNHVGRQAKMAEDFTLYSDETLEAEDKAFMLKLRDTTMAAIEESRFAQVVDKLKEAAGIPIKGNVQEVVELTGREFGITQDEQNGIFKYLVEGGDLSLYGLTNAVTRASQDVESYDRATALEGIGWQIMQRRELYV